MSLGEVLKQPFVAEFLPPLLGRHHKSLDFIGERTDLVDGTLYFDITDQPVEGYNKFVPYFLHPEATYSVGLSNPVSAPRLLLARTHGPKRGQRRW